MTWTFYVCVCVCIIFTCVCVCVCVCIIFIILYWRGPSTLRVLAQPCHRQGKEKRPMYTVKFVPFMFHLYCKICTRTALSWTRKRKTCEIPLPLRPSSVTCCTVAGAPSRFIYWKFPFILYVCPIYTVSFTEKFHIRDMLHRSRRTLQAEFVKSPMYTEKSHLHCIICPV